MPKVRFRLLKNIVAALFALVFLACAAEVGLRYYDSQTGLISKQTSMMPEYLSVSSQRYCELQPLATFEVKHPDSGEMSLLITNSFGLRGVEVQIPKPVNVLRILCLGDERTLAAETPERETYCNQLQHLLQSRTQLKVEVINAGLPDSCPLLSYLHLRQSLIGLQPDLVILNFDMTDIADDHHLRRHLIKGADNHPLACRHPALTELNQTGKKNYLSSFMLADWGKSQFKSMQSPSIESRDLQDIDSLQGRYAWIRDKQPDWSIYIQQALQPIVKVHRLTEGSYARMMVGVIPAPWQISAKACQNKLVCTQNGIEQKINYRSRVPFELLTKQVVQHQILYCDSSPYFLRKKNPEELYLKNEVRLSQQGHELYARILASFIITKMPGAWKQQTQPSPPGNMATRPPQKQHQ